NGVTVKSFVFAKTGGVGENPRARGGKGIFLGALRGFDFVVVSPHPGGGPDDAPPRGGPPLRDAAPGRGEKDPRDTGAAPGASGATRRPSASSSRSSRRITVRPGRGPERPRGPCGSWRGSPRARRRPGCSSSA